MITRHVYGFASTAPIKAELLRSADEYCRTHGKVLLVTKTVEIPVAFGREASAEVYFKALDAADPELKNPPAIVEIVK